MTTIEFLKKFKGEHIHTVGIFATAGFFWLFLNSYFWTIFYAYVTLRVLKFCFIVSKTIVVHFLLPEYDISHLKNMWTVATGATDGIGRAYINELARARGIRKFYLIGRNQTKLDDLASELKKRFHAEVKTAIFDFDTDSLENLPAELKTMEVGILINMVGIAAPIVGNMVEQTPGQASSIMRVNLMSNIKMNELILPGMLQRDKGVVINMASMTGWRPLPYMSAYPASKAAISFYSDTLSDEFRHTNVKIQCLVPLLVATKLASYDASDANEIFVVPADSFARQAVRAMGNFELITGCVQHDLHVAFGTLVSFWLFKQIFVPLVMLGVHKRRVADYQKTHN